MQGYAAFRIGKRYSRAKGAFTKAPHSRPLSCDGNSPLMKYVPSAGNYVSPRTEPSPSGRHSMGRGGGVHAQMYEPWRFLLHPDYGGVHDRRWSCDPSVLCAILVLGGCIWHGVDHPGDHPVERVAKARYHAHTYPMEQWAQRPEKLDLLYAK